MKSVPTVVGLLLVATSAQAGGGAEATFRAFMEECRSGSVKKAIRSYGIDERKDRDFLNVSVPGDLTYEVENTKEKSDEATVKAKIEYTKITEKAGGVAGKAKTGAKLASGNVVGAAANAGKNAVGDAVGKIGRNERIKMRKDGGEWKVVVTDGLFDTLTGK